LKSDSDDRLSITDSLSRTTNYTYDELNRNTSTSDPLGHTTTNNYDAVSNLIATTDALSRQTKYAYDALKRRTLVTNPENQTVTTNYDKVGNAIAVTDELGRTTSYTYDGRNLQTGVTDPLLNKTTTNYDAVGNVVGVIDPLGNTTSYSYDGLGRKISDVDALGYATNYQYDGVGNLLSLTDPNNNKTSYTYDRNYRMVTDTNSLNKTRTYTYDAVGDRIQVKDRNNRIRKFVYDGLDRNTSETWIDGSNNPIRTFNYTYDAVGELTKVTEPSSTYSYTYDGAGRNTSVDNTGTPGVPSIKFDYSYDAVNNLVQTKDAINGQNKGVTNYVYDVLNRATRINQTGSGVVDKRVDLAYDAASQMKGMTRYSDLSGNNQVAKSDYTYDPVGRLTNLKHSHNGNTIADYGWTYDGANRITKSVDVDGSSDYSYDKTNQLTDSDRSTQSDEAYSYDSNGNRVGNGYSTGANNQLLSDGTYNYEYDGEGNRTKRTEIATGVVDEYVWDYRNRLTSVVTKSSNGSVIKKADYTYDAFDKRIEKKVDADGDGAGSAEEERFVYDGDNLALVFDGNGNQKERFLHGTTVDSVIAQENADGQVLWALADNQGSVRDVVNSNGDVVNHLVYDSFGRVIGETNKSVDFRFGYTGRELDAETGLNYNRARYYDPNVGRFVNEDLSGFSAGDANLYRYVGNNPTNFVDLFGLCGFDNFEILDGTAIGLNSDDLAPGSDDINSGIEGGLKLLSLEEIKKKWDEISKNSQDFLQGLTAQWGLNQVDGILPVDPKFVKEVEQKGQDSFWFSKGQLTGDVVSVLQGIAEIAVGATTDGAGIGGAPITGGASMILTPTGAILITDGGKVFVNGSKDFVDHVFQSSTSSGSSSNHPPQVIDDGESQRIYSLTDKHEPGGWGTPMDLKPKVAEQVLNDGITGPNGKQVYGYNDGKLYEFQPDNVGGFHGYPVPGNEVPSKVLKELKNNGTITNAEYKKFIKGK
jgi:RHS repeat-associated protein